MKNFYQLWLGYFKQGDDLSCCAENCASSKEAFLRHAEMLESAAATLRRAAELELDIDQADTHFISVSCEKELGDRLVAENFLTSIDNEDEDDFECADEHCERHTESTN